MSCAQGWGDEPWGSGPWGGGPGAGPLSIVSVQAVAENLVRVEFSVPVSFTNIKDPGDASVLTNWAVYTVNGSVGQDGQPVRPVAVADVVRPPAADVPTATYGNFVDLILDRPMTPYPAYYSVAIVGAIFTADLVYCLEGVSANFSAVYRALQRPTLEMEVGSRDFANAQTGASILQSLTEQANNTLSLGTYQVGADGDYAFDEGNVNLKKRVVRRIFSKKGGFSWLLNYGVGITSYGKKLGQAATLTQVQTDIETQLLKEPDIQKVKARPNLSSLSKGLVRFGIFVKPRATQATRFDVPIVVT